MWYARDQVGGKDKWVSLETKNRRSAEQKLISLIRQIESRNDAAVPPTITVLLPEYLNHKRARCSKGWFDAIDYAVRGPHFGPLLGKRLDQLTVQEIQRWQDQLINSGLSPASVNKYTGILTNLFKWAVDGGMIPNDRVPRIKPLKERRERRRFFTQEEVSRLLQVSANEGYDCALFVRLGLYAGLRREEILSLRRQDIDRDHGLIVISEHGPADPFAPKSRQERRIPVHADLWPWLDQGVGEYYFPARNEFQKPTEKPYRDEFRRPWDRLMKKAEIELGATPHAMRHTFGTWLARSGCSAFEIQALMGHSRVQTSEIYIHTSGGSGLRRAVQSLQLPLNENP